MPSADIAAAAETAVKARTINNGQSCIAAKRFIVHERIADDFTRRFVERMGALEVGDPMKEETDVGPLATRQITDDLAQQVQATVAAGARVLIGGNKVGGNGNFFEPTVLVDIPPESPASRDELFGPVASIFRARDLEAGTVFINGMVASDPRYPFGGVKNSGYGRELGPWGLHEFVNIKTVRRGATQALKHTE
jgi:succinate-semialdehyde dehydrogenase/glutarate-semialdehyde dehydrogenase